MKRFEPEKNLWLEKNFISRILYRIPVKFWLFRTFFDKALRVLDVSHCWIFSIWNAFQRPRNEKIASKNLEMRFWI